MKALDLFCGGGGAALGMMAAGFDVWGVDINPRHAKVYPGRFVCGDATRPPFGLSDFDFVWASPPCQKFSSARTTAKDDGVDLISETRALLAGHSWTCIENVPRAPIRADMVLVGLAVGLPKLLRRRHFEMSFFCMSPPPASRPHPLTVTVATGVCKGKIRKRKAAGLVGKPRKQEKAEAMGLPMLMTTRQIEEAVPPAYAEYIATEARRMMEAS